MSLSPVVRAVRDAGEKLTGSSNLTREEFLGCVRDLDTALRSPGDDGDAACAEFCAGPPGAPHRAALAWFAGKLRKGVADGVGDPMRKREDVFTTAAALQVLVSASGGDHRATFGHTSRDGSHERWPKRGYALCHARWAPTVLAPTGILPPLLALTRAKTAGPQVWMRALQLAGSIARCDDAVAHEMARTGWPRVCAEVVKAIPDQAWDEARAREFIVEREVWQWLDSRFAACAQTHTDKPRNTLRSFTVVERLGPEEGAEGGAEGGAVGGCATSDAPSLSDTEWYGKLVRVDGTNGTVSLGFAVAAFDDADVAVFLADDGGGGRVVSAGVGRVSLVHDRLRPLREPLQEASTSDGR